MEYRRAPVAFKVDAFTWHTIYTADDQELETNFTYRRAPAMEALTWQTHS